MHTAELRRPRAALVAGLVALTTSGCISGSLATSTGHRVEGPWSVAKVQHAHVGERIEFDFILVPPSADHPLDPRGIADYCVLEIGSTCLLSEPEWDGHFRFAHELDAVAEGRTIKVTGTAYRTHGHRNYVALGQGAQEGSVSGDERDTLVVRDSVTLKTYQVRIELAMDRPPDPLVPKSGRLLIRTSDGIVHSVFANHPDRPGFTLDSSSDGRIRIRYLPRADELNVFGRTPVEFTVLDQTGQPHTVTDTIDTP